MKLIMVILGARKEMNYLKLLEATNQLGKKDTIMVSGTIKQCVLARCVLSDFDVEQSRILVDIKSKGTEKAVNEYINEYDNMTFIAENEMEIRLMEHIYRRRMKIVRVLEEI